MPFITKSKFRNLFHPNNSGICHLFQEVPMLKPTKENSAGDSLKRKSQDENAASKKAKVNPAVNGKVSWIPI